MDKEEPPYGGHASGRDETLDASGRDETLASELWLDGLYEISFRSFAGFKKIVLQQVPHSSRDISQRAPNSWR